MSNPGEVPSAGELLRDAPRNWGRWGADDEIGALNFLGNPEVLRGAQAVRQGKTFTLQIPMGMPGGDPVWPGRNQPQRINVIDEGHYLCGKGPNFPGGLHYADDVMFMYLQGSTQYDALGHVWCDGKLYNGYDANTTIGGMSKASVLPIAELTEPANRFAVVHPSGWRGPGFEVDGFFIWGFTAMLLDSLLTLAGWNRPWDQRAQRPIPA